MAVILLILGAIAIIYFLVVGSGRNINEKIKLDKENPNGKKYCVVVDAETTGLPASRDLQVAKKNLNGFPHIVELGWGVFTKDGEVVKEGSSLIKLNSKIPEKATAVHGITNETCDEHGEELQDVLKRFANDVDGCEFLVGHNLMFDKKIIEAEFLRTGLPKPFKGLTKFDTMKEGKKELGVSKQPKLTELHQKLLNSNLSDVQNHRALVDVSLTAQLFFYLQWVNN